MQGETKTMGETGEPMGETKGETTEEPKDCPCQICFEKTKKKMQCGFCDFEGCFDCVKQSILFLQLDPSCPKCKHSWDFDFCVDNFTKKFMKNEYKTHKKQLLFNIEKSKIPNTMNQVFNTCQAEKISLEIKKKNMEIDEINILWSNAQKGLNQLKKKKREFTTGKVVKQIFKKRCPNEECNGFLSKKYKCYSCFARVCGGCFEIKHFGEKTQGETKEHVCNPDNAASYKAIKDETKNCPKCAVHIFKISGCDQMWCVECKVAFSWKTGMEVTGVIHNPHFYEWKKNNKEQLRNVGEVLCGGLPTTSKLRKYMHYSTNSLRITGSFEKMSKSWGTLHLISLPIFENSIYQTLFLQFMYIKHRQITHFQHFVLDRVRLAVNNDDSCLNHRINFIRNKITESKFKSIIIKNNRAREKMLKILHIYEMFYVTTLETYNDIYHSLVRVRETDEKKLSGYLYDMNNVPDELLKEVRLYGKEEALKIYKKVERMDEILTYCNKELYKVSKLFNQRVDFILPSCWTTSEKYDSSYFVLRENVVRGEKTRSVKVCSTEQEKYMAGCKWFSDVDDFKKYIKWDDWFNDKHGEVKDGNKIGSKTRTYVQNTTDFEDNLVKSLLFL
tara:strand:- start:5217 stop:7061 length:1845 start_codon:yes stop_codon:yes gene_type:complete